MLPFISCTTLRQPWESCNGCLVGKQIVLIEEDAVTGWQLTKALSRAGLDIVATADNVPQGMKLVDEHKPDLVVIDLRQPIRASLEGSHRILERTQVCIILLTDHDNETDREQARQWGISSYLLKPLTGHALVSALEAAYIDFQQAKL